nr:CD3324 family protein [Priestia koreensis]
MAEMKHVKAATVLPEELILEIQQYIQGETIYIPKLEKVREKWGSRSGERQRIDERNEAIREAFQNGEKISRLADDYFLSVETIKKIVYTKT